MSADFQSQYVIKGNQSVELLEYWVCIVYRFFNARRAQLDQENRVYFFHTTFSQGIIGTWCYRQHTSDKDRKN